MSARPDASFLAAVEPHRNALKLHCYRMLGSSHDGDDVMQEVLLRAWRAQSSLDDASRLKPWLYRIATNACLDELEKRPRRALAFGEPSEDLRRPYPAPVDEPIWLEPIPDAWLERAEVDPASRYTLKESVALAFVGALQHLAARERATLLLRDVLGFSAEETAAALGLSVAAANSALHRARVAVEEKLAGGRAVERGEVDDATLAKYVRAWESADLEALVALLRHDVETTMPPIPAWVRGFEANARFYRDMIPTMTSPLRVVPTRANGGPALAFYRATGPNDEYVLTAIQAIVLEGGGVKRIDHFLTREVFVAFGLPRELPR